MSRPRKDERGAIALVVATLAVVLCLMAGIVVDFGMAYNTKRQLQTAADAAALAAASAFATVPGTCEQIRTNAAAAAQAQIRADAYRAQNLPGAVGDPISVVCDGQVLKVTANASKSTKTSFGNLAGVSQIPTSRTATASVTVAPSMVSGLRPLAMCASDIPNPAITGNVVRIDFPGSGTRPPGSCPDVTNNGNWWTLDCPPSPSNGTSDLEKNIKFGCNSTISIVTPQDTTTPATLSASLIAACPNTIPNGGNATCLTGNPGSLDAGQIEDSWGYLIHNQISVVLPVFCSPPVCAPSTVQYNGNNAIFPVHKLAAMQVCAYHFGKNVTYDDSYQGGCSSHAGFGPVNADKTDDQYLLVVFKVIQVSGGTGPSGCNLGDTCDGGIHHVLLVE